MKKICTKCNVDKPIGLFYSKKKPNGENWFFSECKDCAKTRIRENRNNNIEYYREYDRARSWQEKRIEKRKEIAERWKSDPILKERSKRLKKEWQLKNHIKRAAHIIAGNAIKDGRLNKQPCEVCGNIIVDAHHDNYEYPLNVRWLCKKHHAEHHKKIRTLERDK
jgi:hypothetical protein